MRKLFYIAALILWFSFGEDCAREHFVPERAPQAALDEYYAKFGAGIYPIEVSQISFGAHNPLIGVLIEQKELGIWGDNKPLRGRRSSAYGSYGIGVNVTTGPLYYQAISSVGLITDIDRQLGGHFQFMHDLGIGVHEETGVGVGISYKHVSSAGLYTPNRGRDFLILKISLPW